jgi:hypothetical protein
MRRILALPILVCGLALAAGCSKAPGPDIPTASGSASASPGAASGGYSAFFGCLRQHGISVPDPAPSTVAGGFRVTAGQIDPNSPIVTAAAAACRSMLRARGGLTAEQLVQAAAGTLKRK